MKKVHIQGEASIKAVGTHIGKNAKAVICIETGETFTSATDAAEKVGVHYSMMSAVCRGKVRTCKDKHYCYVAEATENLDAIVTRLRETAAVEADAKRWQAYQAEQDAIRKAEAKRAEEARIAREKHNAAIEKAQAKVTRRREIYERALANSNEAQNRLMEAERELEALEDAINQETAA